MRAREPHGSGADQVRSLGRRSESGRKKTASRVNEALEHVCAGVFLVTDEEHLDRALQLARLGRRAAHPNPRVGAVVVSGSEVVGEGYHRGPGTPHAEALALARAGVRARGATLFVTLEPCCVQGRTGPCTETIVAAGVARVVVGATDPNPAGDGRGIEELRGAGIEVVVDGGDLHTLCELLNEPFARFIREGLPFVTFKAAVSLDGKVAAAGGDARWISSPESRRRVHRMRAAADAVMVSTDGLTLEEVVERLEKIAGMMNDE